MLADKVFSVLNDEHLNTSEELARGCAPKRRPKIIDYNMLGR